MKKNISIIVAAVVLVAVLVGGLFFLRKNESDKIVIWAFDTSVVAAEEAVKAYKKDNPDVEFEVVEFSQDQLVQKFRVALASGSRKNLPNIIIEEDYNMQSYFKYYEDYFVDLSDHLDTDDYMDFKITSSTYNDKLLAVPYDSGVSALFYRLDIIQEAGYSEEDMQDLTWDEFIAIGEEVKTVTGKPMLPISPEGNIEGRVMLQSAGKWYYDLDGNLDITDNQAILDTMITLENLLDTGTIKRVYSWDDLIGSFYNGEVAGIAGGSWWAAIIAENPDEEQVGNWRVTKIPSMLGDDSYTNYANVGGSGWMVLDKGNKNVNDIAVDFAVKTFGKDVDLINTLVEKIQLVTVYKDAVNVPNAVKGDPYFGGQNLCQIMAAWGEFIPPVNYGVHPYEIAYKHGELFANYLDGEIDSIEAVIQKLYEYALSIEDNN